MAGRGLAAKLAAQLTKLGQTWGFHTPQLPTLPYSSLGMYDGREARQPWMNPALPLPPGLDVGLIRRIKNQSTAGSRRDVLARARLASLWNTMGDLERKKDLSRHRCPAPSLTRDRNNLRFTKSSQMKGAPCPGSCYYFTDVSHIPFLYCYFSKVAPCSR